MDKKYKCEGECDYSAPLSEYVECSDGWYECPVCDTMCQFITIPCDTNTIDIPCANELAIEFIPNAILFRKESEPLDVYLFRQALTMAWNLFIERREQYGSHLDKGVKYAFDGFNLKVTRINSSDEKVSLDTLIDALDYLGMIITFKEIDNEVEE